MNSTAKGDEFEREVFEYFKGLIESDTFHIRKDCCEVFWKKAYYSRERESNITFDVVIEVYLLGDKKISGEYSSLIIIECKNYSGKIPINDLEEFSRKVSQVAAHNAKAIVATTGEFQEGAYNFAKNNKIGCVRFIKTEEPKWIIKRESDLRLRYPPLIAQMHQAFVDQETRIDGFSKVFSVDDLVTTFRADFFKKLLEDVTLTHSQTNTKTQFFNSVKFYGKSELEGIANQIIERIQYAGGQVKINSIYNLFKPEGLRIMTEVERPVGERYANCLGRIDFTDSTIHIFKNEDENVIRDRFTAAHEIAHFVLGHGEYLDEEICELHDFQLFQANKNYMSDFRRMEFQANYLASCLLMPEISFSGTVLKIAREMNIVDKGHGLIYVDSQLVNRTTYSAVLSRLSRSFNVSRTAVAIRLAGMGFLNDRRSKSDNLSTLMLDFFR